MASAAGFIRVRSTPVPVPVLRVHQFSALRLMIFVVRTRNIVMYRSSSGIRLQVGIANTRPTGTSHQYVKTAFHIRTLHIKYA